MRRAEILMHGVRAGILAEHSIGGQCEFKYDDEYEGPPISASMPVSKSDEGYHFSGFPPFFDGLLPEGAMLESLLKTKKIDRNDRFLQLLSVGGDLVGAVTAREAK